MKIFVAIIFAKLRRSGSGVNVKKTYCAAGPGISSPKRTPEARMVKIYVIFEGSVEFYPYIM